MHVRGMQVTSMQVTSMHVGSMHVSGMVVQLAVRGRGKWFPQCVSDGPLWPPLHFPIHHIVFVFGVVCLYFVFYVLYLVIVFVCVLWFPQCVS